MSKSRFAFELPGREDDEEDLTPKQLAFIKRLAAELELDGLGVDQIRSFGKWQASTLIERLIEIKDGKESEEIEKIEKSSGCSIFAFVLFPLISIAIFGRAFI